MAFKKKARKTRCHNDFDNNYQPHDALSDLEEAISRGQRPLDPRNWDSQATRGMPRW